MPLVFDGAIVAYRVMHLKSSKDIRQKTTLRTACQERREKTDRMWISDC
jgi:hypothetical protein